MNAPCHCSRNAGALKQEIRLRATFAAPAKTATPEPEADPNDGRVHGGPLSYPTLVPPWGAPVPDDRVPFGTDVLSQLDHRNLNLDVPWFGSHIPSAENIAVFIWQQLEGKLPRGRLKRVRLWETPRNWVDYDGE